ncbi:MAG: hypothetical protein IJ685_08255 [Selenomonadaceae bacterium]|nr:hypothetical protein [Selenomonadaceae bacterium]
MTTQRDVIKNFMAILDTTTAQGENALDAAISAVSNFSSYADFRTQLLSDCKAVNNADTFLRTYCGIILDNDDTGAITGLDAGGSVKTAESIVPESGELINFTGDSFTANGLTVKLGQVNSSGNTVARSFSDLSDNEIYLWQSIYTWWLASGLDLISESYGENYSFTSKSSATTKTLWVVLADEGAGSLAVTWGGPGNAQKSTNDLKLHINLYYYGNVTGENGTPDNDQKYLDRTIAHELTHAVMRANIDWFDYLPAFLKEGMADLTHGIDDTRSTSLKTLAGSSTKLGQAIVLNTNTVTVSGVTLASYAGGYIFLRYLAQQNADLTVTNTTASTSLKTFAGNDTITNSASNVTISAGTGDDSIVGGGTKNFYVFTGGNDTIKNFGATDTLSIASDFYRTTNGNNILFTTDDGTILLTGAKNLSTLNVTGNEIGNSISGGTGVTVIGGTDDDSISTSTTLTVTDSDKSPVTINSTIEVVDASSRTKSVKITGNALANTITGGKNSDTLDGGKGDDILTGGNGADIFIWSAGNDTITDYGNGSDKISLNASIKNFGSDGDDFVFEFNNGSLTLTDAADKKISVTSGKVYSDDGIFNSAGTAVTLSSSTENFTADSKVVTIDAGLTSNATITGNSKANKIYLGDENIFVWANGGNDTLYNFGTDDLISIAGAVSDVSISGSNSVMKIGTNKITVKDSSQVTFTDSNGTKIFDGGIFFDKYKTSATLASATKNFTATDNVTDITGNDKANKIISSTTGATLTGGKGNDTFVNAGGNDFITDYGTGSDKISLSSSLENFSVTGSNVALELAKGSVTIQNGVGKKISLVSGGKTTANIFTDGGILNTAGTAVTLNASAESFTADSKVVTIDAGLTSNATITGNSKANKIYLGDENIFVWAKGGNDTLYNFGTDDLISIAGAVSDGSISGGNSVLKIGTNKITVKDSSQVTFTDDNGTKIFDGGIFYDADKTSATLGSAVSNYTAAEEIISVTGNAKANKIYAGDNSATIDGGKGNDSLWGGDGSDTFIYTANTGTDKIFDFASNDMLQILNADGSAGTFTKSAFSNRNLTLNISGGGKVIFSDVDNSSTFNINGEIYHVDGKSLTK